MQLEMDDQVKRFARINRPKIAQPQEGKFGTIVRELGMGFF